MRRNVPCFASNAAEERAFGAAVTTMTSLARVSTMPRSDDFNQRDAYGDRYAPGFGGEDLYGRREPLERRGVRRDFFDDPHAYAGQEYGVEAGAGPEAALHPHDLDPDYLRWRDAELSRIDREYVRWRDERRRAFDAEYRAWRGDRREAFQRSFSDWRETQSRRPGQG